jgi:hypothetical protein
LSLSTAMASHAIPVTVSGRRSARRPSGGLVAINRRTAAPWQVADCSRRYTRRPLSSPLQPSRAGEELGPTTQRQPASARGRITPRTRDSAATPRGGGAGLPGGRQSARPPCPARKAESRVPVTVIPRNRASVSHAFNGRNRNESLRGRVAPLGGRGRAPATRRTGTGPGGPGPGA